MFDHESNFKRIMKALHLCSWLHPMYEGWVGRETLHCRFGDYEITISVMASMNLGRKPLELASLGPWSVVLGTGPVEARMEDSHILLHEERIEATHLWAWVCAGLSHVICFKFWEHIGEALISNQAMYFVWMLAHATSKLQLHVLRGLACCELCVQVNILEIKAHCCIISWW